MPEARHLIDVDSLDDEELERLLERACALAGGARPQRLEGTVAGVFLEPSTRTRVSFQLAAARLGLHYVHIDGERSSVTKGESLEDTIDTLAAMGIGCLVLRLGENGRCRRLADSLQGPPQLVNAGEGTVAHPSQALLDAATLMARGLELRKLKLAVVGDIAHSRVAASGLKLWQRLGVAEIRLAGPESMLPEAAGGKRVKQCRSLAEAVADADVVMMLRIQRERMADEARPDAECYAEHWCLREAHLERAHPGCVVMHPGPINRGVEIDPAVADGPRSLIREQVRMGVFTRMAIFEWLLGLPCRP